MGVVVYFVAKIFKDVYTFHVLKSDKVYDNGRHFTKEYLGFYHIVTLFVGLSSVL